MKVLPITEDMVTRLRERVRNDEGRWALEGCMLLNHLIITSSRSHD